MVRDDTNLSQSDTKDFSTLNIFCSVKLASLRLKAKSPEMIKWVAMAVPLCEVLLALLYNHLYYQIKYKMTAHNNVVTADIVSWPLPIITLDVFKRITENSYSMFCFAIFGSVKEPKESLCLSVRLSVWDKVLILLISLIFSSRLQNDFMMTSWWLQDDFRMTSGWLQDDFRMASGWLQDDSKSIRLVFREYSEHSESPHRAIRLGHTVGA